MDKEIIFNYITHLKMTQKEIAGLEAELAKWESREQLAHNKGEEDLAGQARSRSTAIRQQLDSLRTECAALEQEIAAARRDMLSAAARERTVDPDVLEQEFRILLGEDLSAPEDAATEADTDRKFAELEQDASADAALAALKAKMQM
jgi:phage shock protein A